MCKPSTSVTVEDDASATVLTWVAADTDCASVLVSMGWTATEGPEQPMGRDAAFGRQGDVPTGISL
eukprot:scaffold170769_cov28-Tisochrysis_lutea.AAC.4